ncbi:MAG: tetratricopeptide repeat-containing sensor histidine kinase [Cyclobacteriaceae bacterium]|nr:tetratricopeptide repeat-containing sensor histidine kinase [Cyclobacteriaceae bacterium]
MKPVLLVMILIPFLGQAQIHFDPSGQISGQGLDTVYYSLLKDTIDSNLDLALYYAKSALKHASLKHNHEMEIRANYAQGSIFIKKMEWDSAENYLKAARNMSYENKIYHRLPWIYGELGIIYVQRTKFDLAVDNFIEAIKFSEKFNNRKQIAFLHNEIGIVNLRLENYNEALIFFRKAIELKNEIGLKEGMLRNQLNIAICLNSKGKNHEALEILNNILEECKHCNVCGECSENKFLTNLSNEMGLSFHKMNNYGSAKNHFFAALSKIDSTSEFLAPISYGFIADVYFDENNLDSALFYLDKSDRSAREINDVRTQIFNKFLLSELYEKKQQYKEANEALRDAMDIKNKNFPVTMTENIRKSYVDYERYQSQQIITAKEKIIQRNNQLTILLAVVSILSILTFVFAYKNASMRKKLNEKLSDEVYERARELNSLLYRTSHDLAGPLARMRGLLKLIAFRINDNETSQYLERLNTTTDKLSEVVNRLETISRINVTPLKKEKIDLEIFLGDIIQETNNGSLINPDINIKGDKFFTTDKNLLRHIVNNLLQNSFNHIDQREMQQKIFIDIVNDKKLSIIIGDTGTGILDGQENKIFDLFFTGIDKNNRAGIGLYFANIAVKRLGGNISLKRKRKPTLFEIQIPNSRKTNINLPIKPEIPSIRQKHTTFPG